MVCTPCTVPVPSPPPCLRAGSSPQLPSHHCQAAFSPLNRVFLLPHLPLASLLYEQPEQLGRCGPASTVTFSKRTISHPPQICSRTMFCWTVWGWENPINSYFQGPLQAFSLPSEKARTVSTARGPHLPPARSILTSGHGAPLLRDESLHRRQVAPERRPRRARARWEGRPRGPGLTLGAAAEPG